jgi:flagellar protein FliS
MTAIGYQAYKEQAVNTMTQGEQLLMLYDELVKRLTKAELALDAKDYPTMEAAVERSLAIVRYLDGILNHQYEISGNLAKLYEFMCYDLNRVKIGRNRKELVRVKKMASELREAFQEANRKCGG